MNKTSLIIALCFSLGLLGACSEKATENSEGDAVSTKKHHWKMVTTWPPNFPVFQTGAERFSADVKIMSNGRLNIQVYAGGELVPPLGVFDAVQQGIVQLGHGGAYYWSGKVPAVQFMSTVPFGMPASGANAWHYAGDGLKLWNENYAAFNLKAFPLGNTGAQMGGWFNKKIESTADLKGLKMRMPGLGGKVLSKAGGNPVLMAASDLYTALERNTIDATEWVGPYHDLRLGLHRAAKYYYYPGWHEPGTSLELLINKSAWDSLSPDLQKIVEVAAAANNVWMHAEFETRNQEALQELKEEHPHIEILPYPDEVITELKRLTEETLAEEAEKDPAFKKVYENYKAFSQQNAELKSLTEGVH